MKNTIAILTGGESSEREVALWSSANVADVLSQKYQVKVFDVPNDLDVFLNQRNDFDVVVPMFHGVGGEDGTIQGFLKTLKVPFIFSDVEAHVIGMNKALAKRFAKDAGLNVANAVTLYRGEDVVFDHPVVVKPCSGGSTIGMSRVTTAEELRPALELGFKHDEALLVEDYIEGREFTVPVVEVEGELVALPVIEIISKSNFFDFDSKYTEGKMAQEVCPANIPEDLKLLLHDHALKMHKIISARHVTRTDFIVDAQNKPWFLEINTIPGMTKQSLVPKSIQASGRSILHVFSGWIESQHKKLAS